MVREKPEYYTAYIGVAQMVDGIRNEELSYDFVLSEATRREDTVAIKALSEIGPPPYSSIEEGNEAVQIERMYTYKYSPKPPTEITTIDILKLIFLYDGWSMKFKFHLIANGMHTPSTPILWPQFAKINMMEEMIEWPIPVFIIHGEEDHDAEFRLSKMYFDSLHAPRKEFFPIKNTGHPIHNDQPERYREIYLKQILKP
jgi:pimeloyl-ACP methyl ester carboxylesterase